MRSQSFGKTSSGQETSLYTLTNRNGVRVDITNYGGTITRLLVPDRKGELADVVLGFNTIAEYETRSAYFGCIIGRVGNRVANGRFTLDGKTHILATNNDPGGLPCHLHGGLRGFDKVVWKAEPGAIDGADALTLTRRSPDGEEGYPGNLDATVVYSLSGDNALRIDYSATTDRPTPVNLTNHSYFNLAGESADDILDHVLTIHGSRVTPVNAGLIPTGEIAPVPGTPFDFTSPRAIGERIDADDEQLKFAGGYDHNWVLDHAPDELALAAEVRESTSGRTMEVWTTEPGVQFYSGNFLDGSVVGKAGRACPRRGGLCLETQHHPDSVNQPPFPSIILRPGETYRSTTIYRFGMATAQGT
ncbi:MAG: aldose epimerase family protein [Opitutaceae bacterium]